MDSDPDLSIYVNRNKFFALDKSPSELFNNLAAFNIIKELLTRCFFSNNFSLPENKNLIYIVALVGLNGRTLLYLQSELRELESVLLRLTTLVVVTA